MPRIYSQTELDEACAFVLRTLRLAPPDVPIPVFLRDAAQARDGDVPRAGPVTIAINATTGSHEWMKETLAHEFTHGLGGAGREQPDQCVEEGVANWVGYSHISRLNDLLATARDRAKSGRIADPRQFRSRQAMYGGNDETVARNYDICGGYISYLVSNYGGQDALVALYTTGRVPGEDMDILAQEYLRTLR